MIQKQKKIYKHNINKSKNNKFVGQCTKSIESNNAKKKQYLGYLTDPSFQGLNWTFFPIN